MANEEQLAYLKWNVKAWNEWKKERDKQRYWSWERDPHEVIDLNKANLTKANLTTADLKEVELKEAFLDDAILEEVNFKRANLGGANLRKANLKGANLLGADLRGANLLGADLRGAILDGTNLEEAVLKVAILGDTRLVNLDLSKVIDLETVDHWSPSTIGTDTIRHSKGKISDRFLKGCGLSDWEIESAKLYQPGISGQEANDILYRIYDLRMGQALQINSLFISYSHADGAFLDAMEKKLDERGIRFWRDIHDATAGRLEKVVDQAMRLNPTVLLVLSENSVQSDWVEHEARSARELEKELKRDVLCPVALDNAWKDCNWPVRLREQIMEYNILDFSNWKDESEFMRKFAKLVEGLDLFYKEK